MHRYINLKSLLKLDRSMWVCCRTLFWFYKNSHCNSRHLYSSRIKIKGVGSPFLVFYDFEFNFHPWLLICDVLFYDVFFTYKMFLLKIEELSETHSIETIIWPRFPNKKFHWFFSQNVVFRCRKNFCTNKKPNLLKIWAYELKISGCDHRRNFYQFSTITIYPSPSIIFYFQKLFLLIPDKLFTLQLDIKIRRQPNFWWTPGKLDANTTLTKLGKNSSSFMKFLCSCHFWLSMISWITTTSGYNMKPTSNWTNSNNYEETEPNHFWGRNWRWPNII